MLDKIFKRKHFEFLFLFFPENRLWHEMSVYFPAVKNKKNIINVSSAKFAREWYRLTNGFDSSTVNFSCFFVVVFFWGGGWGGGGCCFCLFVFLNIYSLFFMHNYKRCVVLHVMTNITIHCSATVFVCW